MKKTQDEIELAEVRRISLGIRRLSKTSRGYHSTRWKRALLYAVQMAEVSDNYVAKMRAALEVP